MITRISRRILFVTVFAICVLTFSSTACLGGSLTEMDAKTTSHGESESETSGEADLRLSLAQSVQSGSGGSGQGALSKLQVHGYLTQAYAESKFLKTPDGNVAGPTIIESSLGIPVEGTTDYRTLALQFRYEISPKDLMIIQISSRALGFSPIEQIEDDLELDWAFYERRIKDSTYIKVGKVQIPYGIFNELRDVGTVLPFFRPAFNFYREGAFVSETVEGIVAGHTFAADSDWSLQTDIYFGEWDDFETGLAGTTVPARDIDGRGFQLWLNTPLLGLRWGLGWQFFKTTDGLEGEVRPVGGETRWDIWHTSVDAVFEKFIFRAEANWRHSSTSPFPIFLSPEVSFHFPTFYAQFGYLPTDKLRFYVQYEELTNNILSSNFTARSKTDANTVVGFAVNYFINPFVVIKAEYQETEEEAFTVLPIAPPPDIIFQPGSIQLDGGSYWILSLSASF